ncbi:MAG: universal stress protein [Acidimicrobiia bacterium]|nr:universal stress protein [Acidimicrobiia bacterium]
MIIVVGIDGQEPSLRALARAAQLSAALGAELHVVHAVHIPAPILSAAGDIPIDLARMEAESTEPVWRGADEVLASADVEVTRVTLRGYPPDVLLDYAAEVDAEMIVLGSRGRSELAAFFLGSTGHRVLHFAHCDVHIVKEK